MIYIYNNIYIIHVIHICFIYIIYMLYVYYVYIACTLYMIGGSIPCQVIPKTKKWC